MLTQEKLKSILNFNPETGVFTWLIKPSAKVKENDIAGYFSKKGYVRITINNECYPAHRLVWLYVHGYWPTNMIDHINHDKFDNRIANLREATASENGQNQIKHHSRNKHGYLGVSFCNYHKKYISQIVTNRKLKHLGLFDTPELAHSAYLKAKRDLHPFGTI